MLKPNELFLEYLKKDGHPDRQLKQYEALYVLFFNPIDGYLRKDYRPGTTFKDAWGTTIVWEENAPGATPYVTPENKVCPDITRWKEFVHAPDLDTCCSKDWSETISAAEKARAKNKLPTFLMGTGIFEQLHFLMGFEDTLTNFYEHPQEMHELINYIFEYRLKIMQLACENLHPEVVLSHDDWGSKTSLFMKAETWREFFKEPYRKLYEYLHSQGAIVIHHADSYLVPIVEDMIEIGIDAWQGILPENDIPAVQQMVNGRMALLGGVGAAIDRADSTKESVHAYMTAMLEENCPRGNFIPCITYGAPGTVFQHVDPMVNAEIEAYNAILHMPNYRPAHPLRRNKTAAAERTETETVAEAASEGLPLLRELADMLIKGKRKLVLKLTQQALEEGIDAQQILTDGLVAGMNELGDAFSENRVFVPEMLMAARCMSSATELLKPHLAADDSGTAGKVVLGTVKGDLHDIGKNLVKIMMEGAGLEVIDLGVDVSPENFVSTAIEQNCDIIACSSLLTTTMGEMANVVATAKNAGIRDKIKIMIGGAPISQAYCDEIGADIYTADAAAAARAAVAAISR